MPEPLDDLESLSKVVQMMREQRVKSFKIGDLQVEFSAVIPTKVEPNETPEQQIARAKREADFLLYGSADG